MRINSKLLLLAVLLFLLYLLFFSSATEDSVVNYKGLLPDIKLREFLKSNYYIGQWNKLDGSSAEVLKEFDGKLRFAIASNNMPDNSHEYFEDLSELPDSKHINKQVASNSTWQAFLHIFDNRYVDKHLYRVYLRNGVVETHDSTMYSRVTSSVSFALREHPMIEMNDYRLTRKKGTGCSPVCNLSLELVFHLNQSNIDLSIAYKDASGEFHLQSADGCFASLKGSFEIDKRVVGCDQDFKVKLFNYSSFVIAIAIVILFAAVITYNGIMQGQYNPEQYSILAILFVMTQDVFVTFFMIYLGLNNQQLFHLYFTPALWFFIIFSILDFRLLTLIWKLQHFPSEEEHNVRLAEQNPSFRRKLFCFNLRVYCVIGLGLVILRYAVTHRGAMVLLSLGMVPQMLQIAKKEVNSRFDFYFSVLFLNARLLILVASGQPAVPPRLSDKRGGVPAVHLALDPLHLSGLLPVLPAALPESLRRAVDPACLPPAGQVRLLPAVRRGEAAAV